MTYAITTLRSTLATALTNDGVWSVFTFPPASPIANSCIINYADPAIEPQNNQYGSIGPKANYEITLLVPLFDNQGNLIDMENYWDALMAKLNAAPLSLKIGSFSAPTVSANEMGQMLMSQISVSILTSWS